MKTQQTPEPAAQDLRHLLIRYTHYADESAIEELFRSTRRRLLATARRIGRPQDAEDTVQSAYCALLRHGDLGADVPVLGWLMTTVVRIAYRRKATENRQARLADRLTLRSQEADPSQQALRSEEAELVTRAVHRLPPIYRDAAVLHHLQGLSVHETAEVMNLADSTVTTRLHRARTLLHSRLAPQILAGLLMVPWLLTDTFRSLLPMKLAAGAAPGFAAASTTVVLAGVVTFGLVREMEEPALPESTPSIVLTERGSLAAVSRVVDPPTPREKSVPVDEPPPVRQAPLPNRSPVAEDSPPLPSQPAPQPAEEPRQSHGARTKDGDKSMRKTIVRPAALPALPATAPSDGPVAPLDASMVTELHVALQRDPEAGLILLLDEALRRWQKVSSYRAILTMQERRAGKLASKEEIDYRFHTPRCIQMTWFDQDNRGKKVLFVQGRYKDKLSIATGGSFNFRLELDPTDPRVLGKANHPATTSGFGDILSGFRRLSVLAQEARHLSVEYVGLEADGSTGRTEFVLTRYFDQRGRYRVRRSVHRFDALTLMPTLLEAYDAEGLLERYRWSDVALNPKLGIRPELAERDFYRSAVFPSDDDWASERESWKFADLHRELATGTPGTTPGTPSLR